MELVCITKLVHGLLVCSLSSESEAWEASGTDITSLEADPGCPLHLPAGSALIWKTSNHNACETERWTWGPLQGLQSRCLKQDSSNPASSDGYFPLTTTKHKTPFRHQVTCADLCRQKPKLVQNKRGRGAAQSPAPVAPRPAAPPHLGCGPWRGRAAVRRPAQPPPTPPAPPPAASSWPPQPPGRASGSACTGCARAVSPPRLLGLRYLCIGSCRLRLGGW